MLEKGCLWFYHASVNTKADSSATKCHFCESHLFSPAKALRFFFFLWKICPCFPRFERDDNVARETFNFKGQQKQRRNFCYHEPCIHFGLCSCFVILNANFLNSFMHSSLAMMQYSTTVVVNYILSPCLLPFLWNFSLIYLPFFAQASIPLYLFLAAVIPNRIYQLVMRNSLVWFAFQIENRNPNCFYSVVSDVIHTDSGIFGIPWVLKWQILCGLNHDKIDWFFCRL